MKLLMEGESLLLVPPIISRAITRRMKGTAAPAAGQGSLPGERHSKGRNSSEPAAAAESPFHGPVNRKT